MQKTTLQHLESGAKYSGTSLTLAIALAEILVFFKPDWQPIATYLQALFAFALNLVMVYVLKQGDAGNDTE